MNNMKSWTFVGFMKFFVVLILYSVDTKSLTFVNENQSRVKLKENSWKPSGKLHFKLISNGDDGTVFTAINQNNEKFKLELSKGSFQLTFDEKLYYIPGITNKKFPRNQWNDLHIEQVDMGLKLYINGASVVLPMYRKTQWLMENWKEVNLGTLSATGDSFSSPSFVGCIQFPCKKHDNGIEEIVDSREFVFDNCVDACAIQSCQNGGKCINNYKNAVCDCRGTGYEGPTCGYEAPAVRLTGDNCMLFDTSRNPHLDWRDEISVRFRTSSTDGILLATSFEKDLLLLELHNGSIYATAKFAAGSFHMRLGQNLNDNQWHYVALERKTESMELKLDDQVTVKAFVRYDETPVQMTGGEETVYFGGVKNMNLFKNTLSKENFKGCLQQVYFNRHDVVSKILNGNDFKYYSEEELNECNT